MRPLAIAVVGGLTVSMVLTLIVVPCAYLVIHDGADRLKALVIGAAPQPETAARDSATAGQFG